MKDFLIFFFFYKSLFNLVEFPHLIHHRTTQMQEQGMQG